MQSVLYTTKYGKLLVGDAVGLSKLYLSRYYSRKFNLIITSPPFPLNNKKRYGNLQGEDYYNWFVELASIFSDLLTDDGSLVIECKSSKDLGQTSWKVNRDFYVL